MPRKHRCIRRPLIGTILLCLLAIVYQGYLIALVSFLYTSILTPREKIIEHVVDTNTTIVLNHWTADHMRDAADSDEQINSAVHLMQENTPQSLSKAHQEQGQAPRDKSLSYPLSTVGKIFFTNAGGRDSACSGTAIKSFNRNVVDTAGHCLYYGGWVSNLIFCPLYDHGSTPYGCWAARDLEVPADWINAPGGDFHHDLGMAIVSPNSQGNLTDLVGGAGWAYNQATDQPFYAYGYPAGYPFDGQTRQFCEGAGKSWPHGSGTVVSLPCNMTGGSSGGPWFIKISGNWYLNGHNDFISNMQPGHMFSPYYDDTWYALYEKAQRT